MKKIGVITFSKSLNYGAFLQAFSLQKKLKSLGYDASLIDYENMVDVKRYRIINTNNRNAFINSFIFLIPNCMRKIHFKQDQKSLIYTPLETTYNVAITGSDQVWNPYLVGDKIEKKFFLDGIKADRKLSYAASIANINVVNKYKRDFKKYLEKLDYISVRETSAKESLNTIIDKPITVTADPTLLITKEEWNDAIKAIPNNNNEYIFSYFVGGIKRHENKALKNVCEKLKMKCVSYSKIPKESKRLRYCYTDGPFEFLARLRDSKLVITSSFHGVALSIAMRKNFYYFLPRADKRSRVDSLLELVGLTDRIIETENDIDKINLKDIDYTEPQKKLDKLRQESLDWLKNAIES